MSYGDQILINHYRTFFDEIVKEYEIKYKKFEENMIKTFDYVNLDGSNGRTHSNIFMKLFLNIGNEFEIIIDKLCNKLGYSFSYHNLYRFNILENVDPKLVNRTVTVNINDKIIVPFEKTREDIPIWWQDYLFLQSDSVLNYKLGHLENAITSLASLVIFLSIIKKIEETAIFKQIGIIKDVNYEMRLFP